MLRDLVVLTAERDLSDAIIGKLVARNITTIFALARVTEAQLRKVLARDELVEVKRLLADEGLCLGLLEDASRRDWIAGLLTRHAHRLPVLVDPSSITGARYGAEAADELAAIAVQVNPDGPGRTAAWWLDATREQVMERVEAMQAAGVSYLARGLPAAP